MERSVVPVEPAWFCVREGKSFGPCNLEALIAELATLESPHDTMVWRRGFSTWIAAANAPEVAAELPPRLPQAVDGAKLAFGKRSPSESATSSQRTVSNTASATNDRAAGAGEIHSFKVRSGRRLRHTSDLVLTASHVRLNDQELRADDIRWISLSMLTTFHTGVKTGTHCSMALGNSDRSIVFSLYDALYSDIRADTFSKIYSLALRFYGYRILNNLMTCLANDGSFSIGKVRFKRDGVEIPSRYLLFFSGRPHTVPWEAVECSVYGGSVSLKARANGSIAASMKLSTPNACFVQPLIRSVQQRG